MWQYIQGLDRSIPIENGNWESRSLRIDMLYPYMEMRYSILSLSSIGWNTSWTVMGIHIDFIPFYISPPYGVLSNIRSKIWWNYGCVQLSWFLQIWTSVLSWSIPFQGIRWKMIQDIQTSSFEEDIVDFYIIVHT